MRPGSVQEIETFKQGSIGEVEKLRCPYPRVEVQYCEHYTMMHGLTTTGVVQAHGSR